MSNFSLTPDVANQIAKSDPVLSQNTEQGFANTYGPATNIPDGQAGFAVPALGMSALGLYLLYQKYQQDKKDREEKVAAVDLQALRAQMPGFHLPDVLLGGTAGAGAGLLYDYIRGGEKGKRFGPALRRILTGAALGAAATNLAGDRFRRYVTNSVVPAGYDSGNMLDQLKPRSWQHVYDAALADKPAQDPKAVEKFIAQFGNKEVGQRALDARRELYRIAFGVDAHNPNSSIWQRNVGEKGAPHYSLNEKNKDYLRNVAALMLPSRLSPLSMFSAADLPGVDPAELATQQRGVDVSGFMQNPKDALPAIYRGKDSPDRQLAVDFFASNPLLGAQQLIWRNNGKNIDGMVLDRHDVTPAAADVEQLQDAILRGNIFSSDWRTKPSGSSQVGYESGQTNAQKATGTLGRLVWDRILTHENPWVSQKFRFTPTDDPQLGYGLQMLKNDATPATAPMNRADLSDYLHNLQQGQLNLSK